MIDRLYDVFMAAALIAGIVLMVSAATGIAVTILSFAGIM